MLRRLLSTSAALLLLAHCTTKEPQTAAPPPTPPGAGSTSAGTPATEAPATQVNPTTPSNVPTTLAQVAPRTPTLLTRIAVASDGRVAVSDARGGVVRILGADLSPVRELTGLDRPLGVAWRDGHVLIGVAGSGCVAEYTTSGALVGTVGAGELKMPNDLAVAADGTLWVADSTANRVVAFGTDGALARTLGAGAAGDGALRFPSAVTLDEAASLVWVGDQGNRRVVAFKPDGAFVRALGGPAEAFTSTWAGRFVAVQGLAIDPTGRVLVLDSNLGVVQVLDPESGDPVAILGGFGAGPGQLRLPLGIALSTTLDVLVTNAGNRRIERLALAEVTP